MNEVSHNTTLNMDFNNEYATIFSNLKLTDLSYNFINKLHFQEREVGISIVIDINSDGVL